MAKRTGFILSVGDIEKAWQIEHDIKAEGHTNMSGFGFLRPVRVASHGFSRERNLPEI